MASEQFSQAVRGSGSEPVSVSNRGSLDTNDYPEGDASDKDGASYPYTVNPAETVKEFGLTIIAAEIDVTVTTTSNTTFTFPLSDPATFDRWDVDSIEFKDPKGNSPRIAWFWAGE